MFTRFPGAAATVYGVLGALKSLLRGAVSERLGAGQLVLVAPEALAGGRIKRAAGPDPVSPPSRQEKEPTMKLRHRTGGPQ